MTARTSAELAATLRPWASYSNELRIALADLVSRLEAAEAALSDIRKLVDQQAEDEALWAVHPFGQQPIAEAYLQQELRRLHALVEARAALGPVGCEHEWVDARNEAVISGEVCVKCQAIR